MSTPAPAVAVPGAGTAPGAGPAPAGPAPAPAWSSASASASASWDPADGVVVRGTVLLLPGRGEHPGLYGRFGRRLAFDGYRVVATAHGGEAAEADALAERVAEERAALPAGAPVVLAGSDTGALLALAAAGPAAPDGLLLVGLPTAGPRPDGAQRTGTAPEGAWTDELTARTACPVHRGLLGSDPGYRPGALEEPVPAALSEAADRSDPGLPALLVHGGADLVSPPATARRHAARLAAELLLVADGRHDALNDAPHRSVAAAVVQWLERLRGGPHLPVQLIPVAGPAPVPDAPQAPDEPVTHLSEGVPA
ncbi:lysophospholipase [Streptomyces sp. BE303]|uniref:lysophospholipase n=1 Tax=Streptomyces sp. BE303 TaxID=3002528 RepID=UPI002E798E4F|nr:lysophospholipase [Streptomyces sp. BE303]MED7947520.1 lysophospholipase [Streptomyces sp. BE303]